MDKNSLISLLRASIEGQDKNILNDPAYVFSDKDLEDILSLVVPFHNPSYSINTIPDDEVYFILLLAKKEVYYRLATSSAPYYPLEADGGGLKKNVRFDHYLELIKLVTDEYNYLLHQYRLNKPIEVKELLVSKNNYINRLYNNIEKPSLELTIDKVGDTFVNLSWNKSSSNLFSCYEVYISQNPIIDEYYNEKDSELISKNATLEAVIYDIHKTKYRITELQPDTSYYIAVCERNKLGLAGFAEKYIKTELGE